MEPHFLEENIILKTMWTDNVPCFGLPSCIDRWI